MAVNLLELSDLLGVQELLKGREADAIKERGVYAVGLLNEIAERSGVSLKLRRKK